MKLGMWSVDMETLRRDGLILFSKLIRTKNVENLQEQTQPRPDDRKMKLTVCTQKLPVRIWLMAEILFSPRDIPDVWLNLNFLVGLLVDS